MRRIVVVILAAALILIVGIIAAAAHPFGAGRVAVAPHPRATARQALHAATSGAHTINVEPTPTAATLPGVTATARTTRRAGHTATRTQPSAPHGHHAGTTRRTANTSLERLPANSSAPSTPAPNTASRGAVVAPTAQEQQAATATGVTSAPPVPTATSTPLPFDPSTPSGSIEVPHLDIHAPIYERGIDSSRNLPIAPGYAVTHYWFSARMGQPGNYVIYGHDDIEGSIFRYLPNMRPGDLVYLSNGAKRFTYRVTGSQVVSPDDVAVMDPTKNPTLTMISCTPYWVDTSRIVVTAMLV